MAACPSSRKQLRLKACHGSHTARCHAPLLTLHVPAPRAAYICIALCLAFECITASLIFGFRHRLGRAFVDNDDVVALVSQIACGHPLCPTLSSSTCDAVAHACTCSHACKDPACSPFL